MGLEAGRHAEPAIAIADPRLIVVERDEHPRPETTVEAGLEHLKQAIARFETENPSAEHPAFGRMARQEWVSLGLRHAELHMSFVVPEE